MNPKEQLVSDKNKQIFDEWDTTNISQKALAAKHGISASRVHQIVARELVRQGRRERSSEWGQTSIKAIHSGDAQ